jgi:hypothetical protein
MCVSQSVKRDWCNLGGGDKTTERFGERVGINGLTIVAHEHEPTRIAPQSELQPLFKLGLYSGRSIPR